jgi:hypothetical protein
MNRALGRFLLETWQLFYWSLFFPSKLRHRIGDWSKGNEKELLAKDNPPNSSFLRYSPRFILQHLLLSTILSLPLASLVYSTGDWLLFLAALLLSYSWSYLSPLLSAIGFFSPLLLALVYWQQSNFLVELIDLLSKSIQPFFRFLLPLPLIPTFSRDASIGIYISIIALLITFFVTDFARSLRINIFTSHIILSAGSGLSVLLGSWIASQNYLITIFLTISTSTIVFIGSLDTLDDEELGVAGKIVGFRLGILVGILVWINMIFTMSPLLSDVYDPNPITSFFAHPFLGVALLIPGSVAIAITALAVWLISCLTDILLLRIGLATSIVITLISFFCIALAFALSDIIPLSLFLITCALVAFSCAPLKNRSLGFIIAAIFVVLGLNRLSLNVLWAIPVSLISYYRILPDYLCSYSISLTFTKFSLKWFKIEPSTLLTKLPPYTTELLWFRIPNHSKILEAAFHQNNDLGIATFKTMHVISLPGFQLTIDNAFPKIAPYLFLDVNSTQSLINSTWRNPLSSLLTADSYKSHEIKILYPILQQVANDTRIALQSDNSALRERSLKHLVNQLKSLPDQQLERGLKPQAVKRWQPVIERWQYILEREIAEQQRVQREREITEQQKIQREREIAEQQRIQREQKIAQQQKIFQREQEIAEQQRIQREQEIAQQQRVQREQKIAEQQRIQREREIAEQQRIQREQKIAQQQKIFQREQEIAEQQRVQREQEIAQQQIFQGEFIDNGELLNPFQFGNPLRPDRAAIFKGRQDFADQLVRLILDRNRPTVVLHGPRRAGKTSFLLNLRDRLPSYLVPIYLDMQQGSMTTSECDFCYGLLRAIYRDTRSQGIELPPNPERIKFEFLRPYPTLEDWLDLALPKLGERRLLLNLDEFEKIGSAIQEGRMSNRLFDQLRHMIQHYDQLGFLFSGVQTLEELGPRWSNYFISVVPMEMHYLEPHEAEDLLLNPDPEFTLQYDTGIVAEILRLTRCQPYLLQLIGSALVNQANLQHTQFATTELLQAAIKSALTNGEPYFTNVWTEFTGNKDNPAEVTAGQQILIALAQGNPLVESINEATTAARRRLFRYHVIERDGNIDKIEIPLLEQWVRERAIGT